VLIEQHKIIEYPIIGMIAEMLPSSTIDMLAGLSRWNTRRMPPCFCASAGSASAIASSIPPIVANNRAVRVIVDPPKPRVCPVLLRRLEG
jgi:hypothetical protein